MRIRWRLVAAVLTCTALLTAYRNETTSAHAVAGRMPDAESSDTAAGAKQGDAALAAGQFRFTTGLDREPQHIQGPVTCDTRDGVHRIAIGDPDAGGVEIGLSEDESTLEYVDLGYRNGAYLMMVKDRDADLEAGAAPAVRKAGNTYFVSGYATGLTASQHDVSRYFEVAVACP